MALQFNAQSCARIIHSIEDLLTHEPISPEKGEELQHVLHDMQQFLTEQAGHINQFALSRLQELNQHIIELYGKIDDGILNYKVQQIALEAEVLEGLEDLTARASAVDKLKANIKSLFQTYAPSLEQRRVLAIILEKASRLAQGLEVSSEDIDRMVFVAEEILKEENVSFARLLFQQLQKEPKKFLHYYFGSIEEVPDFLHDVERATNNNALFLSQSKGKQLFDRFAFRKPIKG
jgi:hypothetical protein